MTLQEIVDEMKKLSIPDRQKLHDLAFDQIDMCPQCWGEEGCFCPSVYDE